MSRSELESRLVRLAPDDPVAFQPHFDRQHERACVTLLWGAACIIGRGCPDDGFIDFRNGLLAQGKVVFEAALSDPDSLAGVLSARHGLWNGGDIRNESLGYVAARIYESKTGFRIPMVPQEPSNPLGEDWDFDDEVECVR